MTNRVIFLGAGASHASDFKLPLMKGFFKEEYLQNCPDLKKITQKLYPNNSLEEINMESLITHLDLTLDGFGASWRLPDYSVFKARNEFTNYIVNCLSNPVERNVCTKHRKLFEKIDGNDTILTLNYDSIVENVLFEKAPKDSKGKMKQGGTDDILNRSYELLGQTDFWDWTPPSLYKEHRQLGYLIQLHGSINWLYCSNEYCHFHKFFFPNRLDFPELNYSAGDPCQLCGSYLELVIVPPTMRKAFEKFPKFGLLWSLAFRKLIDAEQVIIIGVSFPDSDYYLKWLIQEAMLNRKSPPKLTNVNPDDSAIDRTKSFIRGVELNIFSDLDKFLMEGLSSI